jgi:uncharacterized membrane protein YfcA
LPLQVAVFAASFGAGIISSLFGVGGGIVFVPGHPDYLQAVVLSAGAFVGAQIGARLSRMTKDMLLQRLLAIVLLAVAITLILDGLSIRY